MAEPLRIRCESPEDLPPAVDLAERVTRGRHAVLHLPAHYGAFGSEAKAGRIGDLAAQLPEEFSVFDSGRSPDGTECISVVRVISRAEVLQHEEELLGAARLFRSTARTLCLRLADVLRVPPDHFWTRLLRQEVAGRGRVGRDWRYYFHGLECCFGHRETGQVVEVCLGYPDEFGVLDPYFFHEFLQNSPGCEGVAALFPDPFHDPARALEILAKRGRLQRVERVLFRGSGWVARE
jgi:hypothetical protein